MRRLIPLLSLLTLGWVGCVGEPPVASTASAIAERDAPALPRCSERLPASVALEDVAGTDDVIVRQGREALCVSTLDELVGKGLLADVHGPFEIATDDPAASDPMPAEGRSEASSDPMPATGARANSDPMPAKATGKDQRNHNTTAHR